MEDERRIIGNRGEDIAAEFLRGQGMKEIERQARTRFGEIDVIFLDGNELVFVEVKTRLSSTYGYPEEAITRTKFRHMQLAAEAWLQEQGKEASPWRLDVIAIQHRENAAPEIIHFPCIDGPCGF